MTLQDLQKQIMDEIAALHACLDAYDEALQAYAVKDHAYRKAQARSLIEHGTVVAGAKKPTDEMLRAYRDRDCELPMYEQRIAEANKDGLKARIAAHSTSVSALQSMLRVHQSEMDMEKYGQRAGA